MNMDTLQKSGWHTLYITDKTGRKMWNTIASPLSTASEIRNLKRHIEFARKNPKAYSFLDVDTAVIVVNGEIYKESVIEDMDAELLKLLGIT